MKRFWHSWMAVVATVAMISPAVAQNDLGQLSEIGSYQSILSRAGYPTSDYGSPAAGSSAARRTSDYSAPRTNVPVPPSAAMYGQPASGYSPAATAYGSHTFF